MKSHPLAPCLALDEVYGQGTCFNPRPTFGDQIWYVADQMIRDCGAQIAQTDPGTTPYVCARALASEACCSLLEQAGHTVSNNAAYYTSEAEYLSILQDWASAGKTVAFQYLPPDSEVAASCFWIRPQYLSDLNNKAYLEDYVPAGHAPRRRLITPKEVLSLKIGNVPVVLKVASRWGGGGGDDVVLATSEDDLKRAARLFAHEMVVVEEFLEIERNVCVNVASVGDEIRFIGTADQIVTEQGKFQGNWLGPHESDDEPSRLAHEIMRKAMNRGYYGFAGFDIAVTKDGRVLCYDLNFRMNSSTRPLMIYDSVQRKFGAGTVGHLTALKYAGHFSAMCAATEKAIRGEVLIPLSVHDPNFSPHPNPISRISALVIGPDRDAVLRAHRWLSELGFESPFVPRRRAAA